MDQYPYLDAAPPLAAQQQRQDPFADLRIASKNYWAGRTGREDPPAPTLRDVDGKMMLGRYMDPFGCQAHLRTQHRLWDRWYTEFFISCAIALVLAPIAWPTIFIFAPIYFVWYRATKAKHRRQYNLYYAVQDQILQTGESAWVPYDKTRLKLIDRNPLAVWP